MPELPEVEVIRRGLAGRLRDRVVVRASWSGKPLRLPVDEDALRKMAEGRAIEAVERRAKYLIIRLAGGTALVLHLGMTGRLGFFPAAAPRARHDHLVLLLDSGLELRFNDCRRFGSVQVMTAAALERWLLAGIGPEPLGGGFTGAYLRERARGRRQPVKLFLMDGRVVAGIGNIYASEILFAARLLPRRPAGDISAAEWRRLTEAGRRVLTRAIECGGTTISDYVNSDGEPGYFALELAVYGREGEPCRRCGLAIERTVLAGRATYHCPHCQH